MNLTKEIIVTAAGAVLVITKDGYKLTVPRSRRMEVILRCPHYKPYDSKTDTIYCSVCPPEPPRDLVTLLSIYMRNRPNMKVKLNEWSKLNIPAPRDIRKGY